MILRRLLFPIFVTVTFCVIAILPCHAKTKRLERVYSPPVEVNLGGLVRANFRDYFKNRNRQWDQLAAATFYPIGWSKDGKFAYYTEPVDEACNCYFAKLFILDLKTDKVLWSFDYDSEFIEEDVKKRKRPFSLETLWRAEQRLFSSKLNENGIVPQGRFAMLTFPINFKGDQLKTNLDIVENKNEESRPYGVVSKATLHLSSKRNGTKTLFQTSYPDALPLDMKVLGYLKSAYEERIAVVLLEVYRGYEGPPHTGHVKIAGATLATGFK